MSALWTDWRKTALGAGALAVLAIMFTHEGGVADDAVNGAQELAGRKQEQIAQGASEHRAWFAADEADYEVHAVEPAPRAPTGPAPPPQLNQVRNAEPTGPDFPPGLQPPA